MAFTLALVFTIVLAMSGAVPTYKEVVRPRYGAASVRHAAGTGLLGGLDSFNARSFVNEKVYGARKGLSLGLPRVGLMDRRDRFQNDRGFNRGCNCGFGEVCREDRFGSVCVPESRRLGGSLVGGAGFGGRVGGFGLGLGSSGGFCQETSRRCAAVIGSSFRSQGAAWRYIYRQGRCQRMRVFSHCLQDQFVFFTADECFRDCDRF